MKKTILLGLILLMSTMVYGIAEGENYTQAQIDGVNADTVNLHCQSEGWWINKHGLKYKFSCLFIEHFEFNETVTHDWTIVREPKTVSYPRELIFKCLDVYSFGVCKNAIKNDILKKFRTFKLHLRERIKQLQTRDLSGYDWGQQWGDL